MTTWRSRLARHLRTRGWGKGPTDINDAHYGVRRRVLALLQERNPWWDWGHRVMIIVGDDDGGNWSEPTPPSWWYRPGVPDRMWRTNYPRHRPSTIELVTRYSQLRERIEGATDDEKYEWLGIYLDQDHQVKFGHYYTDSFYGLRSWEIPIVARWLRMARRHDWYGLRSWLYSHALHAAVNRRKPFSCGEPPPRDAGGYSHWLCTRRRRHSGLHRYANMVWGYDPVTGSSVPCTSVPEPRRAQRS